MVTKNTGRQSDQFEQYWTTEDVMKRLHAGRSTVKKWMTDGRLRRTKAGDKTLISESAIQHFLRNSTEGAA